MGKFVDSEMTVNQFMITGNEIVKNELNQIAGPNFRDDIRFPVNVSRWTSGRTDVYYMDRVWRVQAGEPLYRGTCANYY